MHVPYGFGVGDFVAVGTLAWSVYKSCKAAPARFENISMEVLSLHAVLKESEEILFNCPLQPTRAERLSVIKDGCDKVLVDLQSLVNKYESLGTQSKRTWDRMKWGNEDIAEIRARLISSTTMLNAFMSTSESSVASKLDNFIEEYRQGRREASVTSLQTLDSLSGDDRALWRTIRKDLEEIGISVAAFDANRKFIFDWFIRAAETGAFEEQGERVIVDEDDSSGKRASLSNNERVNQDVEHPIRHTQSASFTSIREERPSAQPQFLVGATVAGSHSPERGPTQSGEIVASPKVLTRDRRQHPPVSFFSAVSPLRRRLLRAVEREDLSEALKILSDEVSLQLLDRETLGKTLLSTTLLDGPGALDRLSLISKLIARGANVNYISSNSFAQTPLWNSVAKESIAAVRLLIENGADVNYYGSKLKPMMAKKYKQDSFARRLALTENTEMLRLLLSAGLDTSTQFWVPATGLAYNKLFPETLIHEAAHLGAITAIEALIEHGAEIDLVTDRCGTALMVALLGAKENVAKFLLDRGANPDFDAGKIHLIIKGFGEYNAELSYERPIEAAIVGGKLSMVRLLLNHGVLPTKSTLDYAKVVNSRLQRELSGPAAIYGTILAYEREDSEIIRVLEKALEDRKDPFEEAMARAKAHPAPTRGND